jgi:hypothetical protein
LIDSLAAPMVEVFDEKLEDWAYTATPSALLANTSLPIPKSLFAGMKPLKPTHDAAYWAEATYERTVALCLAGGHLRRALIDFQCGIENVSSNRPSSASWRGR